MTRPDIISCVLIETRPSENDEQFTAFVTELLTSIYGKMPKWLEFKIGRRILWRDTQFREFICIAGSVSLQIIMRTGRSEGIPRAIILYGSSPTGNSHSREIRNGVETKFDPEELQFV